MLNRVPMPRQRHGGPESIGGILPRVLADLDRRRQAYAQRKAQCVRQRHRPAPAKRAVK